MTNQTYVHDLFQPVGTGGESSLQHADYFPFVVLVLVFIVVLIMLSSRGPSDNTLATVCLFTDFGDCGGTSNDCNCDCGGGGDC
jgi:hypothetical protein